MLYFVYAADKLAEITATASRAHAMDSYKTRNDFRTLADAEKVAAEATALTGVLYIPTDATASTSPRYDVIEAPRVGADVSYAFNGDYYPAGKIAQISTSLRRVKTDQGHVFYRQLTTGRWVKDGTWSMVQGTHRRLNPEF